MVPNGDAAIFNFIRVGLLQKCKYVYIYALPKRPHAIIQANGGLAYWDMYTLFDLYELRLPLNMKLRLLHCINAELLPIGYHYWLFFQLVWWAVTL